MISLTPEAVQQVRAALVDRGLDGFCLKLQVVGGGCEGFLYDLLYVDQPEAQDRIYEAEGVKVCVDPGSLRAVEGLVIGHERTRFGEGFTFHNPRAASSCSCGASFGV